MNTKTVLGMPCCLTIAASDTSGGAGTQKDIMAMYSNNTWPLSVITGITAQSMNKVYESIASSPHIVSAQLATVFENFKIDTVKIGVMFNKKIMGIIYDYLKKYSPHHIVIDPILSATDTTPFLSKEGREFLLTQFLHCATLITPNIPECMLITKQLFPTLSFSSPLEGAKKISAYYHTAVYLKGGHGNASMITDYLVVADEVTTFTYPRKILRLSHGTGCTISSAIAAFLAQNYSLFTAITHARTYFQRLLT